MTYGPLQAGDVVKLTREQGDFVFLGVALGDDDAPLWADLAGGSAGRKQLRTVTCDRLKIPSAKALQRQRARRQAACSD